MKWLACIITALLLATALQAQSDTAMAKQCSSVREIIYLANKERFASIIDQRLFGSSGQTKNGSWTFSNEHFSSTLLWPGTATTTIEHSTDVRDSTDTNSWQYIANFPLITDVAQASQFCLRLVAQINDCSWSNDDMQMVLLQPVDAATLPPTKPDNLADAYLFELPQTQAPHISTSIMIGLEMLRKGYHPMLLIEVLEEKRKLLLP